MSKHNILITGVGGASVGSQILKALKRSDLDLFVIGTDLSSSCANKNEVDLFTTVPRGDSGDYIPFLLKLCEENNIQMIFPGSEPETFVLSRERHQFESAGIVLPINPQEVIDTCADKEKTVQFLKQHNMPFPKSVMVEKSEDLSEIDFFPVILKPATGSGGSANIMIAQNPDELKTFSEYLLLNKISLMAQQYVGDEHSEYTVGVMTDGEGEVVNSIVMKRNISNGLGHKFATPNRTGNDQFGSRLVVSSGLSQGEFIERSDINSFCENLAKELGAKHAINIQGRLVNGDFYVFEINPRYSGTTNARAVVGYNEPARMIEMYLEQKSIPKNFEYKKGLVLRTLNENFVS